MISFVFSSWTITALGKIIQGVAYTRETKLWLMLIMNNGKLYSAQMQRIN